MLLLIMQASAFAQAGNEADSAMIYLTGTFKKYNPAKAFDLFMARANSGEAKAMNAVAIQYMKGLGTDSSFSSAVYWFTQAANSGYKKAWVNLGMLYKRNSFDSAGYAIACNYFNIAVQQEEPSAFFALGYMYYKGLGCNQSYNDALTLFRRGIDSGRADCMYFTGLCFKYGYGVAANTDSAGYYINKAALLGYKQANAELSANTLASNTASRKASSMKAQIPVVRLKQAPDPYSTPALVKEFLQIDGAYTGTLTQFDYSGKKVITSMPLELELKATGNKIQGTWKQGSEDPVSIEATQHGNKLSFTSASFLTSAIKAQRKKYQLVFKSAQFERTAKGDSNLLKGSVQLFNMLTKETEKPVLIQLVNKQASRLLRSAVSIFPNPVTKSFTVNFMLNRPSAVRLRIFNSMGQLVYTQFTGDLQTGKRSIVVEKELNAAGVYILNLDGNGLHESIAFIKE